MIYDLRFTRSAGLLLLSACSLVAANLQVPVADLTQGNVNSRRVTLTSTDAPRQSGAALITIEPKAQFTGANGTTTFTNVLWGNYRLDIAGTPGTAFRFFVPDTNATVSVLTLVTNLTAPSPATNFWNAAQTAAAIAANSGAGAIPTNSGTGFDLTIADQITIGTGSNAVTISASDDGAMTDSTFIVSNLTVLGGITLGGSFSNTWPSGGGEGTSTNTVTGISSTPEVVHLTTNSVVITGTNLLFLGIVSNFTRAEITLPYTNSFTEGSFPPIPNYAVWTSTNGVDYEDPEATYTVPTWIALYDANGSSSVGYATAITIYGYTNSLLVGNVIDLFSQSMLVDAPTNSRGVVNLGTAESLAATAAQIVTNWAGYSALSRPDLAGLGLAFSAKWSSWLTSTTNESTLHFGPFGDAMLSLTANDILDTNTSGALFIDDFFVSGTNLVLLVSVTNVISPIIPQYNTNSPATNTWVDVPSYTSTYPNATNGLYRLVFPVPVWTNATTYRVRSELAATNVYSMVRELLIDGSVTITGPLTVPTITDTNGDAVLQTSPTEVSLRRGNNAVLVASATATILYDETEAEAARLQSGVFSWTGTATGNGGGLTNLSRANLTGSVPVTNYFSIDGAYPTSEGTVTASVYGSQLRSRSLQGVWGWLMPSSDGFKTNIYRLRFVTTSSASPANVTLGVTVIPTSGLFTARATDFTSGALAIPGGGNTQTNIVTVSWTNTTATPWGAEQHSFSLTPSGTAASTFFISGSRESYP